MADLQVIKIGTERVGENEAAILRYQPHRGYVAGVQARGRGLWGEPRTYIDGPYENETEARSAARRLIARVVAGDNLDDLVFLERGF